MSEASRPKLDLDALFAPSEPVPARQETVPAEVDTTQPEHEAEPVADGDEFDVDGSRQIISLDLMHQIEGIADGTEGDLASESTEWVGPIVDGWAGEVDETPSEPSSEGVQPEKLAVGGIGRSVGQTRGSRRGSGRVRPVTTTGDGKREKKAVDPDEDITRTYLQEIGKIPLLEKEDEARLAQQIEAGQAAAAQLEESGEQLSTVERRSIQRTIKEADRAREQFVKANLRLVVSIAKKYQASGLPLLDLVQEGNMGLMHAVEKFDWRKGFKFSTYATWWIRQAITRGIANTGRTIRLPVHAGDTLKRVRKAQHDLRQELGGSEPSLEQLSLRLEMPVDKIEEVLMYTGDPLSLDEPVTTESGAAELGDLVADPASAVGYEAAEAADSATRLRAALAKLLDQREAEIVRMRFGLDRADGEPRTLEEVSAHFGLTRERIRQIEQRAMAKMRHPSSAPLMR